MKTRPVLVVIGPKGGAGKTTLAVHLARALGTKARPALLVDLDPQAAASSWLLTDPWRCNVAADLEAGRPARSVPAPKVPGVLVAPGDIDTAGHDAEFERTRARFPALLRTGEGIGAVVVDTPPSWGALVAAALASADAVLVAVECRTLGLVGLDRALDLIARIQDRHRGLRLLGIVPQRLGRTRDSQRTEALLRERYRAVLPAIRESARIGELPARNLTIFEAMPEGPARGDFEALAAAVLRGLRGGSAR